MSDVEAVVLDLDGGEALERCLDSLRSQTLVPRRILVVDNGSRIPVSARLAESDRSLMEILRCDRNLGFTGGINRAMRSVRAPFVAWINNDVELDLRWLETLRQLFTERVELAAAQSIVSRRAGSVDGAGISIEGGRFRQVFHGTSLDRLPSSIPAWGVSATAALFRVAALREVARGDEILDSRFFAYYEDVELSARLRRAGWALAVHPEALARHEGSMSADRLGSRATYLRTRNRYWVTRLHPGIGRRIDLLQEDLRRMARLVARGAVRDAATMLAGVVAGWLSPRVARS